MNKMNKAKFYEYMENTFDYLEYLGMPPYLEDYNPEDVGKSFSTAIAISYTKGISHRMAALMIFGITWWKIKVGYNIDKVPYN